MAEESVKVAVRVRPFNSRGIFSYSNNTFK